MPSSTTGADAPVERFTSTDTFANPSLASLTNTATAVDAQGIERIVIPSTQPFESAPLTATDEQKAHMDELNKTLEDAAGTRAALLKGEVTDANRAPNQPGNAGSQTGVTSSTSSSTTATTPTTSSSSSSTDKPAA